MIKKEFIWLLIVLLACMNFSGCSTKQANSKVNEVSSVSSAVYPDVLNENGRIITELYECSYPLELQDVIKVVRPNYDENNVFDGNLDFYAVLSDTEVIAFSLMYNSDQGDWNLVFETEDGEQVKISFVMYDIPESLIEGDRQTFYAAQEVVNEIVYSLIVK